MGAHIMSQELEIEFKNLLTKPQFTKICEAFAISSSAFKKQVNHYFDTASFSLRKQNSALRIRQKGHTYTLTLKQPHETGLLETHQSLTEAEMTQACQQQIFPTGEVTHVLDQAGISAADLQYLGALTTYRAETAYKYGTLVFDHSYYHGHQDFEMEWEAPAYEGSRTTFMNLLANFDMAYHPADNKIKRFYEHTH